MKNAFLLLLTACVNPKGMTHTKVLNPNIRLDEYRKAITFYLETTLYPVVVVDNSGYDFNSDFMTYVERGRLECLCFDGNSYDKSLGKGYGEGLILSYAFQYSKMIRKCDNIIKITGRHKIVNINQLIKVSAFFVTTENFIVSEMIPKSFFCRSDIFIASKDFYSLYLIPSLSLCNDSEGIWFEHILYRSVIKAASDGFQFLFLPVCPWQEGKLGSTGQRFKKPRFRRHLRFFMTMLFFKLGLRSFLF